VLAGGADAGGEMAVAPGSGPSLFSPLLSFSSSLVFCFVFFSVFPLSSSFSSLLYPLSPVFFSCVSSLVLSLSFFSVLPVPLLCLCIYRQRRAVKMPCLCPVRGQGRVDKGASWGVVGHRLGRRLFEV